MEVAVLGVGLIGGSIGMAARQRFGAEVSGFDADPGTLTEARAAGALDREASSVEDACKSAEVIFCAAPVQVLGDLARRALAAAPAEAVVTDVGSTKREISAALASEPRFIGGHPIAGAETAGVGGARAELFDGARWYLTPTERSSGLLYDRLQRVVSGLGARPEAIDADDHDRLMAGISHLPHVVANALVEVVEGSGDSSGGRLAEAGPSLRDATRVAGANPAIWGDIYSSNREALAEAIDTARERLGAAAELVRSGDAEALAAWQREVAGRRDALLRDAGAAGPLRRVQVLVPNRPGTVAELALSLGRAGVNIEDMALHPAQDMASGAVSFWVAGDEGAEQAAELARELGHTASVGD